MKQPIIQTFFFLILIVTVFSCTVVKRSSPGVPFIFENTVKIKGNIKGDKKTDMRRSLEGQIEDSALSNAVSKIPWPKFPWVIPVPVISKPVRFDSNAVKQSVVNMTNLMTSMGYRNSTITYDTTLKQHKKQSRIKVNYTVDPGKLYRIDTIVYNIYDSSLLNLVLKYRKDSKLKQGAAFDYGAVDQELSRIVDTFHNNGYYKFSRDDIIAEVDTSYNELIDPSLDPFEYVRRLAEIEEQRKQDPRVDIFIRLNAIRDTTHLDVYSVGEFTVYPDLETNDSLSGKGRVRNFDGIKVISYHRTFNSHFVSRQIELRPGEMYSLLNYGRTLNNFNRLGAWANINLNSTVIDSNRTINYNMLLYREKKRYFSVDLEGSSLLNSSQLIQVGSGRIGLALNFALRHRNIARKTIQLENNLRTGIEFNDFTKILSSEVTLTNRLIIPWVVAPFKKQLAWNDRNARTIISADISYIDRFQYYRLRTINTFLGYEWKPKTGVTWTFKPVNVEFTRFRPDSLFIEAILDFPLLLYTYNDGLIIGSNASWNKNFNPFRKTNINLLRIYAETSGILAGAIFKEQTAQGKALSNLYRFVKMDVDYRLIFAYKKSSLRFRVFGGYGFAFKTQSRTDDVTLPFFKSYFGGGPNSMRGWQIRKLGIGSNIFYDTVANGNFSDKYADVQMEGNVEYRFAMFQLFGFWFNGALFADVGNIWYRKNLNGGLPRAELNFGRFYKDLCMDAGFGVRMDFKYFLIRFDLGFPIKDSRYGPYNTGNANAEKFYSDKVYGWFIPGRWNRPALQFAIGYPF